MPMFIDLHSMLLPHDMYCVYPLHMLLPPLLKYSDTTLFINELMWNILVYDWNMLFSFQNFMDSWERFFITCTKYYLDECPSDSDGKIVALGVCWAVVLEVKGKNGSKAWQVLLPRRGAFFSSTSTIRRCPFYIQMLYKARKWVSEIYVTAGHVAGSCRTARRNRSSDKAVVWSSISSD